MALFLHSRIFKFANLMSPFSFCRRSSETRRKALEDIRDRAQSSDNKLPQLFLCPEGTNTNRKVLIQFKIGAFAPGVPVQPVLIRYPGTERIG